MREENGNVSFSSRSSAIDHRYFQYLILCNILSFECSLIRICFLHPRQIFMLYLFMFAASVLSSSLVLGAGRSFSAKRISTLWNPIISVTYSLEWRDPSSWSPEQYPLLVLCSHRGLGGRTRWNLSRSGQLCLWDPKAQFLQMGGEASWCSVRSVKKLLVGA